MPLNEERNNILRIGPPEHTGDTKITPAMVAAGRPPPISRHPQQDGASFCLTCVSPQPQPDFVFCSLTGCLCVPPQQP